MTVLDLGYSFLTRGKGKHKKNHKKPNPNLVRVRYAVPHIDLAKLRKLKNDVEAFLNSYEPISFSYDPGLDFVSFDYPLLTPSEEKEVFGLVYKTRRMLGFSSVLHDSREYGKFNAVKKIVREGDSKTKGLEVLVDLNLKGEGFITERNTRLVHKLASGAAYRAGSLTVNDLISHGGGGLLRAISKFEVKRGYKLSTYATWWINQAINRAIDEKSRFVAIPVNQAKLRHTVMKLTERELKSPEVFMRVVLEGVGVKCDDIKSYQELDKRFREKLNPTFVYNFVRTQRKQPASLDYILDDDEDKPTLGDLKLQVRDVNLDAVANEPVSLELLDCLDERERKVIINRFGLNGAEPRTLKEISNTLKKLDGSSWITRERVRQIQTKALRKMRKEIERKGYNPDKLLHELEGNKLTGNLKLVI